MVMGYGDLTGKTVVITGASKGLGARACEVLASAGAHVVGVARSTAELETLQALIEGQGGQFQFAAIDLMTEQAQTQLDTLFAECPPDVFINNAGMTRPATIQDVQIEDFDAVMGLNLRAGFFATQSAVRAMLSAPKPENSRSIIHMSSMLGHIALPGRAVYAASKHALEGLTKAMALELAPHRIRVNSICPTYIETPLTQPLLENEAFRAFVSEKMPLSNAGKPIGAVGDLDGAVIFLADSSLSDLVTGTNVLVDGGWAAQ